MKKCLKIFVVFVLMFTIFNCFSNQGKQKGYAMDNIKNKYVICIDNFDNASDEYKQMFWDLKIPLTFKVLNKQNYSNFGNKFDKVIVEHLVIPRTIMSIVADGDAVNLRQTLYNASEIAKTNGVVVVIFDLNNLNQEDVFYAISDTISVLNNLNLFLCTYDCFY